MYMSKTKNPKPDQASDIEEEVVEKTDKEIEQELAGALEELFQSKAQESKLRIAELYGVIEEEMASNIVASMLILRDTGRKVELHENKEEVETYEPFELFISTPGGTASDMFAIYDTMRMVKEDCEIHTIGMGKVMSAGVVLMVPSKT